MSFPALLAAGVPAVMASATNTVALAPGSFAAAFAYRKELAGHGKSAVVLAAAAGFGSLAGATLLLVVPARVFELVVPWLVLLATLTLLGKDVVARWVKADVRPPGATRLAAVALGMAAVAIYGGYFGAGIGIITLALLAMLREADMHAMNAQKTLIVGAINGVAAVYFIARGAIDARAAALMAAAALAGGYAGARFARRVPPARVRMLVVVIGVALSVALAVRYYLR